MVFVVNCGPESQLVATHQSLKVRALGCCFEGVDEQLAFTLGHAVDFLANAAAVDPAAIATRARLPTSVQAGAALPCAFPGLCIGKMGVKQFEIKNNPRSNRRTQQLVSTLVCNKCVQLQSS